MIDASADADALASLPKALWRTDSEVHRLFDEIQHFQRSAMVDSFEGKVALVTGAVVALVWRRLGHLVLQARPWSLQTATQRCSKLPLLSCDPRVMRCLPSAAM
jgi:hypothetical protein